MARAIADPAVAGGTVTAARANPRAGASRGTDHATPVHRSSRRRKLTPAVDRARRDADRRPRRLSSRMLKIGFVVIPMNPRPCFVRDSESLGPTLTWVGLVLLAIGAASAALHIFRPAHRRLRTLEHAARALGEGRTDVRAVEGGGDEVSALATAFNRMAHDLGARAAALAASDCARRQLLAEMLHELMTPLAAVRGYTETLSMPELNLDAPTRSRYLAIIGDENATARVVDWRFCWTSPASEGAAAR